MAPVDLLPYKLNMPNVPLTLPGCRIPSKLSLQETPTEQIELDINGTTLYRAEVVCDLRRLKDSLGDQFFPVQLRWKNVDAPAEEGVAGYLCWLCQSMRHQHMREYHASEPLSDVETILRHTFLGHTEYDVHVKAAHLADRMRWDVAGKMFASFHLWLSTKAVAGKLLREALPPGFTAETSLDSMVWGEFPPIFDSFCSSSPEEENSGR
ncbi:uncharacterized protein CTRU02_202533 [Colletotrichum truncatum]|uniref:Uncharacterized protein n=1 Tax=Colletotrichum truncatum TaxID=5467 RepID=A0ACC3ZKJ0_COLTU|nr:uncharacterized protein CTRU02_01701 [Colletotrichum truncatum]KAF6800022.1 hypothetical protein CTRU02_01701 [Colletotrichum truncatum]